MLILPRPSTLVSRSALGYEPKARALIKQMSASSRANALLIFMTYYGLKDYDSALEWMRRAIDDRSPGVFQIVRLPNSFAGLREQPGYAEVLEHLDSLQRSP